MSPRDFDETKGPRKSDDKSKSGDWKPKYITEEHTIGTDEALSTIALHYYGHATPQNTTT